MELAWSSELGAGGVGRSDSNPLESDERLFAFHPSRAFIHPSRPWMGGRKSLRSDSRGVHNSL